MYTLFEIFLLTQQSFQRNGVLNMSIIFETVLAIILSYTPYLNQGLMMYPLK